MKYLDGKLCIEYEELVPDLMTLNDYKNGLKRDQFVKHGIGGMGRDGGRREIYIEYESLSPKYQEAVRDEYGDPYAYASQSIIADLVEPDPAAKRFFEEYVLPNGTHLPNQDTDLNGKPQVNKVARYTRNAEWLQMIIKLTENKANLKKELNITMPEFWKLVGKLFKSNGITLPKSRPRLQATINNYKDRGYEALVVDEKKYGNDRAKKIVGELAEATLFKMLAGDHDDTIVVKGYNLWAAQNNLPPITVGAVAYWRKAWYADLLKDTRGIKALNNELSRKGHRERPSGPLLLVTSDDNHLDAYFTNFFRPTLYVVWDAFNDYPLGYAWHAGAPTDELVKRAYRDAFRHVQWLTNGGNYCWQEINTDRWHVAPYDKPKTQLQKFYESMAWHSPAALHIANSKYAERAFGVEWHQKLKLVMNGHYSGYNITAKTKRNDDKIVPSEFPEMEEASMKVAAFIESIRHSKRKGSTVSRQEEWKAAFLANEKSRAKTITEVQRLMTFGIKHAYDDGRAITNEVTSDGVTPTLLEAKRFYVLTQEEIFTHIGKPVQVYYDDHDLSRILVTDGKGWRKVLDMEVKQKSCRADREPGDKAHLQAFLDDKKTLGPMAEAKSKYYDEVLAKANVDPHALLQAGAGLPKDLVYAAQAALAQQNNGSQGANGYENTPELGDSSADYDAETGGVFAENDPLNNDKKPLNAFKQPRKSVWG